MTNRRYINVTVWVMFLLVGGCVDPYRPPEITSPGSYLVVNGFFDSAPGATTTIQLSRTGVLKEQPAIITQYAEFTYLTTTFGCVDCRYKGPNKRPSFWE